MVDTEDSTSDTETAIDTPVETTTETPEVQTSSDNTGEVDTKGALPATPAYVPDYKLKVYDEEKELDDPLLKSLIKDADSEKKVKEIAQKYLGFDTVKSRHEKTKGDFQTYQQQTKPIVDVYNSYQKAAQKGDLEGIFSLLKIPDDVIFNYAVKKAEEMQLPQDQRNHLESQKQIAREREHLAAENQNLQSRQHQQLTEFRNQELSWTLQKPDVASVMQAFDAKNGQNSFRELVRNQALAHYASTNGREDLTAEQAVAKVMQMIGGFVQPTNLNGQPAPQQAQLIQQNGAPPIIPNVVGRGTSPVKKQLRSIAELKKLAHDSKSAQ